MGVTGARGVCPICRTALWAPTDDLIGEKRCPRCSAELWAVVLSRGPVFFPRRQGETPADLLTALTGPVFGIDANGIKAALQGADPFDMAEMLWEVEEASREQGY